MIAAKKMCVGIVIALVCTAASAAQVAKLPKSMADCILENINSEGDFVRTPTVGLLMEGGFLKKNPMRSSVVSKSARFQATRQPTYFLQPQTAQKQ